jgi:hypothetical protein
MYVNIGRQLEINDAVVHLNFYLFFSAFLGSVMNNKVVTNFII